MSAPPPAKETASLIEKETLKKRTLQGRINIEYRIINIPPADRSNVFCLFYKKRLREAIPPFDPPLEDSKFDIRYSAVRFLCSSYKLMLCTTSRAIQNALQISALIVRRRAT